MFGTCGVNDYLGTVEQKLAWPHDLKRVDNDTARNRSETRRNRSRIVNWVSTSHPWHERSSEETSFDCEPKPISIDSERSTCINCFRIEELADGIGGHDRRYSLPTDAGNVRMIVPRIDIAFQSVDVSPAVRVEVVGGVSLVNDVVNLAGAGAGVRLWVQLAVKGGDVRRGPLRLRRAGEGSVGKSSCEVEYVRHSVDGKPVSLGQQVERAPRVIGPGGYLDHGCAVVNSELDTRWPMLTHNPNWRLLSIANDPTCVVASREQTFIESTELVW